MTEKIEKWLEKRADKEKLKAKMEKAAGFSDKAVPLFESKIDSGEMERFVSSGGLDYAVIDFEDEDFPNRMKPGRDGVFFTWEQAEIIFNLPDSQQAEAYRYVFGLEYMKGCDGKVSKSIDSYLSSEFDDGVGRREESDEGSEEGGKDEKRRK